MSKSCNYIAYPTKTKQFSKSDLKVGNVAFIINPLTPNDHYRGHTAPLTSKHCILCIYSTNIGIEHFKHGIHSPFLSLQNAVCFIIIMYLVPVLFTFYIQCVLKLKKNNSGAKRLRLYISFLWHLPTVHQMSLAHNPLHVCKILDTTGPMHFHSGKSKAHLISHFTADAFNVPLVTFNIFN